MRFCLLLALVLLAGHAGFAQALPPLPRPDSLATAAPPPPAADTLAAIHKLFAKRRRQQMAGAWGIGAAAVVGIALEQLSSATNKNLNALGIGASAIPVLAIELFALDGYNRKYERQAMDDFRAHKPSKWLNHKLKPRFFR